MSRSLRAAVIASLMFLILAATAQASGKTYFHFANAGNMTVGQVARVEKAVTVQVNTELLRHWARPRIAFGSSGINVYVEGQAAINRDCEDVGDVACHANPAGVPVIYLLRNRFTDETVSVSHEVMETVINPGPVNLVMGGRRAEVADPVSNSTYDVNGVWVSDFVYPNWFVAGSRGPWDEMDTATRALDALYGYDPGGVARLPVQRFTVVNDAGVDPANLDRIEQAVSIQSTDLHAVWNTPLAIFSDQPGGWVIHIVRRDAAYDAASEGVHGLDASGRPEAEVFTFSDPWRWWSLDFSHEVLEMLVDPYGGRPEVCDPIASFQYYIEGVMVSDFAWPAWYRNVPPGTQKDQTRGVTYVVG